MVTFPNAKINIGLDIISRRADGYHEIKTMFYPIAWKDILEIVPSSGGETTLTVTGTAIDCPVEKNLVMKAFRAMERDVDLPACDIYLHKIIPSGAGLGGGSSDAAHALLMLNEMFGIGYSKEQLADIAGELGADCPFFIYNLPITASGTGTDLKEFPLSLDDFVVAVVKPEFGISTKEAYANCHPKFPEYNLEELLMLPVEMWKERIVNGFEAGIDKDYPKIKKIKKTLYEAGAVYASMSGSGSAVYGLFKNDKLAVEIKNLFPEYKIFIGMLK